MNKRQPTYVKQLKNNSKKLSRLKNSRREARTNLKTFFEIADIRGKNFSSIDQTVVELYVNIQNRKRAPNF